MRLTGNIHTGRNSPTTRSNSLMYLIRRHSQYPHATCMNHPILVGSISSLIRPPLSIYTFPPPLQLLNFSQQQHKPIQKISYTLTLAQNATSIAFIIQFLTFLTLSATLGIVFAISDIPGPRRWHWEVFRGSCKHWEVMQVWSNA